MRGILEKTEERESIEIRSGHHKLFGILHRPICCETPPLAIIFHGFASNKHGTNRCYVKLAESLAQQGTATLRFDFRGSGDSEGQLSEFSLEDLLHDALAVLEYAEEIDGIDKERMALFGASLGGALALFKRPLDSKK